MWTKQSQWLYIYFRIKRFRLPLVIPLGIFWEFIDALEDIFRLYGRFAGIDGRKLTKAVVETVCSLTVLKRFDLVDVDAGDAGQRVRVKICLR